VAAAGEEPLDLNKTTSASTVARPVTGLTNADQEDAAVEEVALEIAEADHRKSEVSEVSEVSDASVADIKAEEEAEADQVKADLKSSEKDDASSAARKDTSRGTAQTHEEADQR